MLTTDTYAGLLARAMRALGTTVHHKAADELERLQSKISRIGGVVVDVLEWADAQDPELRPEWVDDLTLAVEEE